MSTVFLLAKALSNLLLMKLFKVIYEVLRELLFTTSCHLHHEKLCQSSKILYWKQKVSITTMNKIYS